MAHGARPLRSTKRLQLHNLMSAMPKWYAVSNSADPGQPTMVSIYDEIGLFGVSASDFMAEMSQIPGDIELHLNTPGGDVFDGIAIYNTLKQSKGQVSVIIDGLDASISRILNAVQADEWWEHAAPGTYSIQVYMGTPRTPIFVGSLQMCKHAADK